ncbi:transposase [Azohydromonas australica]|uniref:transposase n=1 Tax=Azohydromonas australica TaxID=364039 RepID=UPI0007E8E608|nr:transposase [Azohydromonas australica]
MIDDELRAVIEPLPPPPMSRRKDPPGLKPADPRRCLTGLVFDLKTGIQREDMPVEVGVYGRTYWRRLLDWHAADVRNRLHAELLARLRGASTTSTGRVPCSTPP